MVQIIVLYSYLLYTFETPVSYTAATGLAYSHFAVSKYILLQLLNLHNILFYIYFYTKILCLVHFFRVLGTRSNIHIVKLYAFKE